MLLVDIKKKLCGKFFKAQLLKSNETFLEVDSIDCFFQIVNVDERSNSWGIHIRKIPKWLTINRKVYNFSQWYFFKDEVFFFKKHREGIMSSLSEKIWSLIDCGV